MLVMRILSDLLNKDACERFYSNGVTSCANIIIIGNDLDGNPYTAF